MKHAGQASEPGHQRYKPIAWYIPFVSVTLILALLLVLGIEQHRILRDEHLEQIFQSLSGIEQNAAETIDRGLQHAGISVKRYADTLSTALSQQSAADVSANREYFDANMEHRSDGSWRNRLPFDGREQAALVVPNFVELTPEQKAIFATLKRTTDHYGRGAQQSIFANSWVLPVMGGEVIYWPGIPDWLETPAADFDYRDTEWVQGVAPDKTLANGLYWTAMAFDPVPEIWMMSAVAPLWRRGEWFGSVGHDVLLDKLIESTQALRHTPGAEFILATGDGLLLASDHYADAIIASAGKMSVADIADPRWQPIWQEAKRQWLQPNAPVHIRFADASHHIFASRMTSQPWYLIQRVPTAPIEAPIDEAFTHIRNITITAFVVEMLITIALLWWNYRRTREFLLSDARARQVLAESERRYRSLVVNVPGTVYRCANDENWTMHFISSEVEKLTGYPADDFIQNARRTFTSVIVPEDRERVARDVDGAIARRQPWTLEYRVQHAHGHCTWVHEKGMGIYDDAGQLLYLDGVMVDVNQQKMDEQALKQLNEELESRVQARTADLQATNVELEAFSYSVSHDLRAPLRHILGFVQVLRDELGEDAKKHHDILERITKAGTRMQALIGGLLALSHIGRKAMHMTPVNLNAVIENIMPEINQPNIHWDIEPLGTVDADERLIQQVFANLLSNAIKYSSGQTQIAIRVRKHDDLAHAGERVFSVQDNGVGFPQHQQRRLFRMFQRLHTAREFPGEGIGLAITYKIILLHQGRIWAESTPGQGACFYVGLPLQQACEKPVEGDV